MELASALEAARPCPIPADLVWESIPPRCRGRIWPILIGNAVRCTPEMFDMCLHRARRLRAMHTHFAGRHRNETQDKFAVQDLLRQKEHVDMVQEPFSFPSFSFGHENTLPVCVWW
jgi:hypothetical protein